MYNRIDKLYMRIGNCLQAVDILRGYHIRSQKISWGGLPGLPENETMRWSSVWPPGGQHYSPDDRVPNRFMKDNLRGKLMDNHRNNLIDNKKDSMRDKLGYQRDKLTDSLIDNQPDGQSKRQIHEHLKVKLIDIRKNNQRVKIVDNLKVT